MKFVVRDELGPEFGEHNDRVLDSFGKNCLSESISRVKRMSASGQLKHPASLSNKL